MVNALGWKVIEMLEGGDPESAEMVITRLARDVRYSDRDPLLTDLAGGLALRGYKRLASLATALAYTCTWQRWLRHGGSPSQFLQAIELDQEVAWATLAEEIAERIAHGGSGAAGGRLVGVLVAAGRVEDAFSVWESALGALLVRGPLTGLDYFRDPFGLSEILTPHPITILAGRLACTAVDHGLTLVDSRGDSAVVSCGWREYPFGEEDTDQEHRRKGSQLLVRPDIFEEVCSRSPFAARFVTVVREVPL